MDVDLALGYRKAISGTTIPVLFLIWRVFPQQQRALVKTMAYIVSLLPMHIILRRYTEYYNSAVNTAVARCVENYVLGLVAAQVAQQLHTASSLIEKSLPTDLSPVLSDGLTAVVGVFSMFADFQVKFLHMEGTFLYANLVYNVFDDLLFPEFDLKNVLRQFVDLMKEANLTAGTDAVLSSSSSDADALADAASDCLSSSS